MNIKLLKKIEAANGWLQFSVSALNREVFLCGDRLCPILSQTVSNMSPDGFNWGYGGSGPAQLSLAILIEVLSVEDALKYFQTFKAAIISKMPSHSFEGRINIAAFLACVRNEKVYDIHAFDLLRIVIGKLNGSNIEISKFLDFPYLPYASGTFKENTVEFKEMDTMEYPKFLIYCEYLERYTKRLDKDGKEVFATVLQYLNKITYKNGLGAEKYDGFTLKTDSNAR